MTTLIEGTAAIRDYVEKFPEGVKLSETPLLYLAARQVYDIAAALNIQYQPRTLRSPDIPDPVKKIDNFKAGDPSKLTNPVARKKLGEAGFISSNERIYSEVKNRTVTVWTRGTEMVMLHEEPDVPPMLYDKDGKTMRFDNLGVRNPQTIENTDV